MVGFCWRNYQPIPAVILRYDQSRARNSNESAHLPAVRRHDVLEQFLVQRYLVRHVENFAGEKLALVGLGALQCVCELEFPFLLVDGVRERVLVRSCVGRKEERKECTQVQVARGTEANESPTE